MLPFRLRFRPIWLLYALAAVFLVSLLLTAPLQWINPPTTAFILQDGQAGDEPLRARWVPLERMAGVVPMAVVASEDQKFPNHFGFDFEAIAQALAENRDRTRGASTLTQQLAKNLYLWPGRSLFRKGIEAWLTLWIELTWSKERILEVYLNVVEFGPGVYGIFEASDYHFGKTPDRLTEREAALLAAVLPNPKRMSAGEPSSYVYRRALDIEHAIGYLGGSQYLASVIK
ncbi:monofunctional biosynthetic peptidoglycan transglycosylase [Saccharospirillum salsuginis]|uniref:Biosynthetic peptidoglycan transglycosylase n=1 Tax=Saccharospirillum salsuginis TaxID=418750 RepID=A0A918NEV2_9GAMM|nr:monofunctional biosynthetic peptidoglycan transglycosylase [Saccharospirillum salsuginis]GGX67732.1 monofunctional biosynthetic peptidoglycan transglycosylase [Saccharospirillum salsuginis]